ncbi:MAG: MarR family transcriptional regulator [Subdoligranulum sp.]|nr:MarR family transcriptional regulator [Subdoligranulum sp.]
MKNTSIDKLCELFLQTINQYNALEKKTHTYDINPPIYLSEIHTIVAVGAHEAINVTGLAQLQGTSKSAVSQAISKLVKKGFIEKRTSPDTDNEVILLLTEKGKQVFNMHESQHDWLKSQLAAVFEKYPQDTLSVLSGLAIDIQTIWAQLLEK